MTRIAALLSVLSVNVFLCIDTFASCAPRHIDLEATVARVLDGDTLELTDHTRIRIIGINAPEINHRARSTQAFAAEARTALTALLGQSTHRVALQYGSDRLDRYGRTLAHVFLPDGTNLAQQMLIKGLAARIAFPPNMWAQDCYRHGENRAREQQRGLWQHIVKASTDLAPDSSGFHIIEGRVTRVGLSKKSVWLNFSGHFGARIAYSDLKHFADIDFNQLSGRTLQVRGWIYAKKDRRMMRLRHSSMLDIMK